MFEIKYSNRSIKFLRNVEKQIARRILDKIEKLRSNPIIHDSKRIRNTGFFRVRVGSYSILYEVDYKASILGVVKIDKRSKVY